jgi:hypothetical protein
MAYNDGLLVLATEPDGKVWGFLIDSSGITYEDEPSYIYVTNVLGHYRAREGWPGCQLLASHGTPQLP